MIELMQNVGTWWQLDDITPINGFVVVACISLTWGFALKERVK